ncbi:MAG: a-factor receptor [Chrysothrix sp. TS-e1954]|nr:MAG: a-factor receptor [Chrysothrix sp. TS-e1954]
MSHSIYATSIVISLFSLVTLILDLPPLLWHARNRNFAAASLIFWIVLLNFFNFVNAIIWPSDEVLFTPGYYDGAGLCDIEVKIEVGSWAALSGTLASIMWDLAKVMDTDRPIIPSQAEKRRQFALDIILSWGFPIYLMLIHYIVQSNRYYLPSVSGCTPSLDNSWVSIILIFVWPLVLAVLGAYFALLLVVRMRKYRQNLNSILQSHNTTRSRFMRLFAMSAVMIIVFTPLQVYILLVNAAPPLQAYSWKGVHGPGWNDLDAAKVPTGGKVVIDRWIRIGAGILVFLFFGVGQDARDMYVAWLTKAGLGSLVVRRNRFARQSGSSSWDSLTNKAKSMFSSRSKTTQDTDMTTEDDGTRTSTSSKSEGDFADSRKMSILEVITSGGNLHQHGHGHARMTGGRLLPLAMRRAAKNGTPVTEKTSNHSPATEAALMREKDSRKVVAKKELWQDSEKVDDQGMSEVTI